MPPPPTPPSPPQPPTLHTVAPLNLDALASSLDLPPETRTSVASLIESWDRLAVTSSSKALPTAENTNQPPPMLWSSLLKLWEGLSTDAVAADTPRPSSAVNINPQCETLQRAAKAVDQMDTSDQHIDLAPHVDMDINDDDVTFDGDLDDVRRLMSSTRKRLRESTTLTPAINTDKSPQNTQPNHKQQSHCPECGRPRDTNTNTGPRPSSPSPIQPQPFTTPFRPPPPSKISPRSYFPPNAPTRPAPRSRILPPLNLDFTRASDQIRPVARRLDFPLTPRSPPAPAQRRCITRDPAIDRRLAYRDMLAAMSSPVTPTNMSEASRPVTPLQTSPVDLPPRFMHGGKRPPVVRRLSYQEVREARRRKLVQEQKRVKLKLRSKNLAQVPKNTKLPAPPRKEDRSAATGGSPTDVRSRWR